MMLKRIILIALMLSCGLFPVMAAEPDQFVMVPMRDGTKLATDIYLPDAEGGSWPAVLVRSTYGRKGLNESNFRKRSLALVIQDVRGMGGSEGDAHVFYAEGWRPGLQDGADTAAWIHGQAWCNGKVGTFGGSALGITQMLLAPAAEGVAAQCIDVAPADFYTETVYPGGVFRKSLLEGWLTHIRQPHIIPVYKEHSTKDEYWRYMDTLAVTSKITAPALFVGGWYDIFQQGTLNAFMARESRGGTGAKGNNRLIMKWSSHGPDVTKDYALRENRFDVHVSHVQRAFFDAWLKAKPDALEKFPKVQYYVMGADTEGAPGNVWRTADTWPPFETKPTPWYLHADGRLDRVKPEGEPGPLTFTFDPENPVPTHGGDNLLLPSGPFDQRKITEGRKDILRFQSDPLEEALEVTGRMSVRLSVSTDAPDTDFTAKLLDIYPEGDDREIIIHDGIRRVKFRNGFEAPAALLKGPDEVVEIEIDLWSISWIFAEGHRIGLQISSSNFPKYEVNPNTGADHPGEGKAMRKAENSIQVDAGHSSMLFLPLR